MHALPSPWPLAPLPPPAPASLPQLLPPGLPLDRAPGGRAEEQRYKFNQDAVFLLVIGEATVEVRTSLGLHAVPGHAVTRAPPIARAALPLPQKAQ